MSLITRAIKSLLPETAVKKIRPFGHGFLALIAAAKNGNPSKKLIVIGVTGTAGKSTTVQILSKILNDSGRKTGFITTVSFFNGEITKINKHGMSMPGGMMLQAHLTEMIAQGCTYAIVECTSEGLAQNRHLGIDFDAALVTNISPAHLDSHGSWSNYLAAKQKLFKSLALSAKKPFVAKKILGINLDDEHYKDFCVFGAEEKFGITFAPKVLKASECGLDAVYQGKRVGGGSSEFSLGDVLIKSELLGEFNSYNILMALACANTLGVGIEEAAHSVTGFNKVSGRMEKIENNLGLNIFVDYAPEPVAVQNALKAVNALPHNRIVHVFGSTGGHRDVSKRFEFGKISSELSDIIIITNDDVYDSDPKKIAEDVRTGISSNPHKKSNLEIFEILDRKEAIKAALQMSQKGDTIIFTGKGSEQFLVLPNNKRIDWDERNVIENALQEISKN